MFTRPFPLTQIVRVADAVANELEKRILEGSLRPGDRLPAERSLATEFGVSRPSLREAIQKLAAKGLIATRHGGGNFVTDKLEAPFVDPWLEMLDGHPPLHSDLLEFRQMLESQAAYLAAERATEADLARLDAAHATLVEVYARDDRAACVAADVGFHQVVAEAAHNVLIGHLSASLMKVIHGHVANNIDYLHARPQRWNQLEAQHEAIWRSIRARDAQAAAQAARGHIEFVRRSMIDTAIEAERRHSARRRLGETSALS